MGMVVFEQEFPKETGSTPDLPPGCRLLTPGAAEYSHGFPSNGLESGVMGGVHKPHHHVLWRKTWLVAPASAPGPVEGPPESVPTLTLTLHVHFASGVFFPLSPVWFSIFSSFLGA